MFEAMIASIESHTRCYEMGYPNHINNNNNEGSCVDRVYLKVAHLIILGQVYLKVAQFTIFVGGSLS